MFNPFIIRMRKSPREPRPWQHLVIAMAALISSFLVFVLDLGLKDAARVANTPAQVGAVVVFFVLYLGAKLYYGRQISHHVRKLMGRPT